MLPGAKFSHPFVRGAGLRMDASGKAEHRHRASRCGWRCLRRGMRLQPREQLTRVRLVEVADFFDCGFHGAHAGQNSRGSFADKLKFHADGTRRDCLPFASMWPR